MSGFVITLDALLAVMTAALMITAGMQLIGTREFKTDDYLVRYSYDFLTVAEKNGYLAMAIDGNQTYLADMIDRVQPSLCLRLEIVKENGQREYLKRTREQRVCEDSNTFTTASRIIPYEGDIYIAKTQAWY